VLLLVLKERQKEIFCWIFNQEKKIVFRDVVYYKHVFLYQRVKDTTNETDNPNIHDEDQHVLSQSSQFIFAPCDNVENNINNDHESKDQHVLSQSS